MVITRVWVPRDARIARIPRISCPQDDAPRAPGLDAAARLREARAMTNDCAAADADPSAWWRGAVVYQIYPRSFADTNGDGVGDLPGIAAHLDYVASLGVDAVWISPFFASPQRDYGYDVSDYRAVDPMFGTVADCDALIARAHALGLKVLFDLVFAHTSDAHAWFAESRADRTNPRADWYVWADAKPDGSPPSNWQSVFGGAAWTWDSRRRQYYMHNFLAQQPQLNVHRQDVQDALIDVAAYWLDRGVDGFRLDAINYAMHDPALTDNPPLPSDIGIRTRPFDFQRHVYNQSQPAIPAFLARLRAAVDARGGAFLMGEIGGDLVETEMKTYTADERHLHSAYAFSFLAAPRLTPALVRQTLGEWPGLPGEGWPTFAFSNHDAPRVASRWDVPAGLALTLLLCLRGTVCLYQGEELGLPQGQVPFERLRDPEAILHWPLTLGRDGARTPMPWRFDAPNGGFTTGEPWLPVDPAHLPLAVDAQEADAASPLHLTRRLTALRRSRPALRTGVATFLDVPEPLLAFERGEGAAALLCLFNLGGAPARAPDVSGWRTLIAVGDPPPAPGLVAPFACAVLERATAERDAVAHDARLAAL